MKKISKIISQKPYIIWAVLLLFGTLQTLHALPSFADGATSGDSGIEGASDYSPMVENAFMGQKKVTDEDFDKALNEVKARQKKKKRGNKKGLQGKSFNEETSGGYIKETAEKNLVLSLPVNLITVDLVEIPIGLYKIVGKKVKDSVYLDFYQGPSLIASVPATETNSDFDQPNINFVKMIPYNEKKIQVIYGSIDFNAYTFIKIEKPISDEN